MTTPLWFCTECGLSKELLTIKNGNLICSQCHAEQYVKEIEDKKK